MQMMIWFQYLASYMVSWVLPGLIPDLRARSEPWEPPQRCTPKQPNKKEHKCNKWNCRSYFSLPNKDQSLNFRFWNGVYINWHSSLNTTFVQVAPMIVHSHWQQIHTKCLMEKQQQSSSYSHFLVLFSLLFQRNVMYQQTDQLEHFRALGATKYLSQKVWFYC